MSHDSTLCKDPNTFRVTIKEKSGATHIVEKTSLDFNMNDYPTREQLLAKYWDQIDAYGLLTYAAANKLIELVDKLEDISDMREITELLVP